MSDAVFKLFPTPHANMTTGAGTSGRDGGLNLQTTVAKLLPTPSAVSYGNNQGGAAGRVGAIRPGLDTIVRSMVSSELIDWQEYEPAIRRWERISGLTAPYPATLGPRGGIKPSPEFVEWMMALPTGHVSGVPGLSVNEKLKLLGNGIVVPSAEKAIRYLLSIPERKEEMMTNNNDTSSFFTTHQSRDVPRDQWGRYELPDPTTGEKMKGWTRATTFAATMAEQYGLSIWKQRQVVWGLSRRPDLLTMAQTISGPEDKKALGAIVDEAHIAAGTQSKANRGTAVHSACHAAERGAFEQVPEELRPHVAGYFAALKEHRLEVMPEYVERTVIVKSYHVAGTFDNLVRCPDGKVRVLDKKTGRLDYSDVEFAIQMALYANADAIFNYDTGRYEPMPEIAKDYAILMHIDPETGKAHPERVNIVWGWTWARTSAEVMAIRKTKHIVTPYVTEESVAAQWSGSVPSPQAQMTGTDSGLPFGVHEWRITHTPQEVAENRRTDHPMDVADRMQALGDTPAQIDQYVNSAFGTVPDPGVRVDTDGRAVTVGMMPPIQKESGYDNIIGTVPGGIVDVTSSVPPEFQAFWFDDRHDYEHDPASGIPFTEHINGVPLTEYGKPNAWPCARGEACEFTGNEGLHTDGTVCLYGNARPGPIPPRAPAQTMTITEQTGVVGENLGPLAAGEIAGAGPEHLVPPMSPQQHSATHESGEPTVESQDAAHAVESNWDELTERINKGDKAAIQNVARKLMAKLDIKEGAPNAIKLSQYKIKIAGCIVSLAAAHGASIPGFKDDDPDFGVPTPPATTNSVSGPSAQKASAVRSGDEVTREQQLRTAVESIRMQTTIEGLTERHDYYAQTTLGWTEEMQNAARTRAAEIDAESGQSTLSPLEMIQGATSRETLAKAYTRATNGGTDMTGWTEQLNAAAMAKQAELESVAMSGNQ